MEIIRSGCWFTEDAIKVLEHHLKPEFSVFEFGMGSSTVCLYDKCNLYSVDHDTKWFDWCSYILGCLNYKKNLFLSERPYNNIINNYSDNFFDIIIVDGRDRVKCIESSIPKLKSGGWLILDNSERPYYQRGIDLMQGWERKDYYQPEPDKYGFTYPDWTTSIFIKP